MSLQYGGGCQVQWSVPSTMEGYLAVRWRAIMKYSGGCKYGGAELQKVVDLPPNLKFILSTFLILTQNIITGKQCDGVL